MPDEGQVQAAGFISVGRHGFFDNDQRPLMTPTARESDLRSKELRDPSGHP
jgi:hypothetical protein